MGAASGAKSRRAAKGAAYAVQVQPLIKRSATSEEAERSDARGALWQAVSLGDCKAGGPILQKHGSDAGVVDHPCATAQQPPGIEGDTPLSLACRLAHVDLVSLLLGAESVDVNRVNSLSDEGGTPLTIASESGHAAVVRVLLSDLRVEANVARADGCTALFMASQNGHTDVVQLLLAVAGIDVNKPDKTNGFSPLIVAACKGRHLAVTELLQAQADINAKTHKGYNALLITIDRNDPVIRAALLMNGADATAAHSPLFRACVMGTAWAARGALHDSISSFGGGGRDEDARLSPLHEACLLGDEPAARSALQRAARGAGGEAAHAASAADGSGLSALYYAAELRELRIARLLLDALRVPAAPAARCAGLLAAQALPRQQGTPGERPSSAPARKPQHIVRDGRTFFHAFVTPFFEDRVYVQCAAVKEVLLAYLGSVAAARFFARDAGAFRCLHALSVTGLRIIQDRLEGVFREESLGRILGDIGSDVAVRPSGGRQDDEDLLPTFPEIYGYGPTATFYEDDYIDALQMLSCALDKAFFLQVESSLSAIDCSLRHPPIKSRTRMRNKLGDPEDHLGKVRPRPAHNIDTMRCAATFADADGLVRGYKALVQAFGTPVRVKNSFRADFDPSTSYGYRSVMLNLRFDTGLTFEEVFGDPTCQSESRADWDTIAGSHVSQETSLAMQRILREWFRHEAVRRLPIAMAAEVQLIFAPYLQARKESHLLYKVARCRGAEALVSDAASRKVLGSQGCAAMERMQQRVADLIEFQSPTRDLDVSMSTIDLEDPAERSHSLDEKTLKTGDVRHLMRAMDILPF